MDLEKDTKGIKIELHEYDSDAVMHHHVQVRLRDLFPGTVLPCDFFFPTTEPSGEIRPGKIFFRGQDFRPELQGALIEEGIEDIYVRTEDEDEFLDYFNLQMQKTLTSPQTATETKTRLLYDNAEIIVKKVYRENPNEPNILLGKNLVENLATHLLNETVTTNALISLFSKDYYTYTHCVQVAILGMAFCRFLNWTRPEIADFGIGALFHDIGKNTIREEILNKPGKLEKHEYENIKQHCLAGFKQLQQSKMLLKCQLEIVLYHHEAMDGSGYPEGLFGNAIPRYARLAHIIDVFDALTSERIYKSALSKEEAIGLMRTGMRTSFDEELLEAFCKFVECTLPAQPSPSPTIHIANGTRMSIQPDAASCKIKTSVLGVEPPNFLLLRVSDSMQLQQVRKGMPVIARYILNGEANGFRGQILDVLPSPFPLMFLSYPQKVEKVKLRREKRAECFLAAEIEVRDKTCRALLVDISFSGCRVRINDSEKDKLPPVLRDEAISIRSHFPGQGKPIRMEGYIRNLEKGTDGTLIGIHFTTLPKESAGSLQMYIDGIDDLIR